MFHARLAALFLVPLLLQACATPYPVPVPDPVDAQVVGIGEYIRKAAQEPSTEPVRVDVVAIHGMCVHGAKWQKGIIATMGAVTGLPGRSANVRDPLASKASTELDLERDPHLLTTVFEGQLPDKSRRPAGVQVALHTIVWSPLLMPARQSLCYDVSEKTKHVCDGREGRPEPGFDKPRAWANAKLKNELMDGCLVDAIYYAGAGKARLREFVANALREAIRPSGTATPSQPVPALFILSESLGSKMVFDVVKTMKQEKEARILRLANQGHTDDATQARNDLEQLQQDLGRTVTLFMAANQIPILSVADAGEPGEGLAAFNELHSRGRQALLQQRRAPSAFMSNVQGGDGDLRYVAISDPNDVLTWQLRNSGVVPKNESYKYVDVTFSAAATVLGLVANPYEAHTTYFSHEPIRALLRDGIHPR
jgi:hypothetical protein